MKKLFVLFMSAVCLAAMAEDRIAARRMFRSVIAENPDAVERYLDDEDSEIRRFALYKLFKQEGIKVLPALKNGMQDKDRNVRMLSAMALNSLIETSDEAREILAEFGANDEDRAIRSMAQKASWPFNREVRLLRNDPSWDHEVKVAKSFELPAKGWKFALDEKTDGHLKDWYKVDFNASGWKDINIGYWEEQGFADYNGVAWYRVDFDVPANDGYNAVELAFGAVDESAWIWLNGIYLGCHDIGPNGWNVPFAVDATKEVKYGSKNTIVVRVLDRSQGGGIWQPIRMDLLK